jgi:fumarate reductase subunit D
VIVKVLGIPRQPFACGVTLMFAIIGDVPILVVVKLGMFPLPVAAKPIEVLSFAQSKVVPVTLPVNAIMPLAMPLHFTILAIEFTVGIGFTVMVNVLDEPGQLLADGVTVIVAVTGVVPAFSPVKEGIELLPEAAIPIVVGLDDQV